MRSASPLHLPRQSAPRLANRATGVGDTAAQAPASARTASVFPQPGGPWNRIPLHGGLHGEPHVACMATAVLRASAGRTHCTNSCS